MARARSPLAVIVLALAAGCLASCLLAGWHPGFLPAPAAAPRVQPAVGATKAAVLAAAVTAAAQPMTVLALEDEEEGVDLRILAVLALPLLAISWALFNVWRVAFRQVIRIGESSSGSSKAGLGPED
mmetsp:Transcript_99934/g.291489  ORF Transcript_99934/g.291489 Transcript_99934/m.291489 type:complete len:127 (+) Transcript_99934:64-444(+)